MAIPIPHSLLCSEGGIRLHSLAVIPKYHNYHCASNTQAQTIDHYVLIDPVLDPIPPTP